MPIEHRVDLRYQSSQKAILLTEGSANRLSIISNFSNRGLCAAVIGPAKLLEHHRIRLKLNGRTFHCNIVSTGKEGLHCSFDSPMDEPYFSESLPPIERLSLQTKAAHSDHMWDAVALPINTTYNNRGEWKNLSNPAQTSYGLTSIYTEGCMAGRQQIDPMISGIDTTIDSLNPYIGQQEREQWRQGFKDGIDLLVKHSHQR